MSRINEAGSCELVRHIHDRYVSICCVQYSRGGHSEINKQNICSFLQNTGTIVRVELS